MSSVTLVNCDHIGWNSSKIISPLVSLGRSLFASPTRRVCSKDNTLNLGPTGPPPVDLSVGDIRSQISSGDISATGCPIHFMFCSMVGVFGDGGSNGAIFDSNKFKRAAAVILENFVVLFRMAICPQRLDTRSTYIARIAQSSLR